MCLVACPAHVLPNSSHLKLNCVDNLLKVLKVSRRLMIQVIIVSDFILTEAIMKFKCDDCEKEYASSEDRENRSLSTMTFPPTQITQIRRLYCGNGK